MQHTPVPNGRALVFSPDSSLRARNVKITSSDDPNQIIYQCNITVSLNHSKPTIEILAGGRALAQIFNHWTTGLKVGIDPSGSGTEASIQWVEMKKGGITALARTFTFDWQGKSYVLTRMRDSHLGVTGMKKLLRHYKVVEEGSGEVAATYLTEAAFGRRTGTLVLKKDMERDLELLIVSGIAAWREMARRQQRSVGAVV